MNFIKKLFNINKKNNYIKSITNGEVDKNSFAYIYINGEKTKLKMKLWDKDEVDRLRKIGEKMYNNGMD